MQDTLLGSMLCFPLAGGLPSPRAVGLGPAPRTLVLSRRDTVRPSPDPQRFLLWTVRQTTERNHCPSRCPNHYSRHCVWNMLWSPADPWPELKAGEVGQLRLPPRQRKQDLGRQSVGQLSGCSPAKLTVCQGPAEAD